MMSFAVFAKMGVGDERFLTRLSVAKWLGTRGMYAQMWPGVRHNRFTAYQEERGIEGSQ